MPRAARSIDKADDDIREGEARIAHHMLLIEEMRRDGHDTGDAEKLLRTLQQSLTAWKQHRETIRARLAAAGKRKPPSPGS